MTNRHCFHVDIVTERQLHWSTLVERLCTRVDKCIDNGRQVSTNVYTLVNQCRQMYIHWSTNVYTLVDKCRHLSTMSNGCFPPTGFLPPIQSYINLKMSF